MQSAVQQREYGQGLVRESRVMIPVPASGDSMTPDGAATTHGMAFTAAIAVAVIPGLIRLPGDCSKYSSRLMLGLPSTRKTIPPCSSREGLGQASGHGRLPVMIYLARSYPGGYVAIGLTETHRLMKYIPAQCTLRCWTESHATPMIQSG